MYYKIEKLETTRFLLVLSFSTYTKICTKTKKQICDGLHSFGLLEGTEMVLTTVMYKKNERHLTAQLGAFFHFVYIRFGIREMDWGLVQAVE